MAGRRTHGGAQPRAVRTLRLRQVRPLVRPLARSVVWLPLPAGGALGLAVLGSDDTVVLELRLAAVSLCVGAAFVLDDVARDSLAASPSSLLLRRLLRISLLLPPVAALWGMMLWRAGEGFQAALTLELAAMLALTLAIAAAAAALSPDGRGGVAAAAGLLLALGAAGLLLPDAWTLFPFGREDPRWSASHVRWGAVLVGAAVLVVFASRDPAARGPLARGRRAAPVSHEEGLHGPVTRAASSHLRRDAPGRASGARPDVRGSVEEPATSPERAWLPRAP